MKKSVSNNIIRIGIHWKSWGINCLVLCYACICGGLWPSTHSCVVWNYQ